MIRDLKKYNPQQVSLTRPRSEGGKNEAATRTTLAGLPPPRILRFCSALDGDLSKSAAVEDFLELHALYLHTWMSIAAPSYFFAKGECQAGRVAPICPACISAVNVATTYYLKL